ncbi:MAG: hypothetical protein IT577_13020 [Verrucomicrobiae bacterium]|nr:hypothetical protein [Verrucomicrobiae bacterium]
MAWGRPKNGIEQRLRELEKARRSTAEEIDKIRGWVGEAREGNVDVAPPPRKAKPLLGVEKRRARARFALWMLVLVIVVVAASRLFFAR